VKTKADAKAATVTDVQSGAGGTQWTVTANLAGLTGEVLLRVLDDDSITRVDNGVALGGPGSGNGKFEFNGGYVFHDMLRPEDTDFVGSLNYLDIASQPYFATYVPGMSFSPNRFDANGAFMSDGGSLEEPYKIPGNTLLESYEFALITHMLNHPGLDLSARGGPKAADIIAAWNNNLHAMQTTLGGDGSISDVLLPGMDTMLTGYMTLGDNNSTFLSITLITMLNAVDNFPVQVGTMDPGAYTGYPEFLAPKADPDGDGWSNEKEFAYFLPDGPEGYAAAALDPNQVPKRGDGLYAAGESVRLPLLDHPAWDGTIQWYRNGQPLSDGANVSGSRARCLVLSPIEAANSGNYTCVYQTAVGAGDTRVYTDHTYGPLYVRVGEKVPVAAPAGLALLAAAAGLGGVSSLRRRRR